MAFNTNGAATAGPKGLFSIDPLDVRLQVKTKAALADIKAGTVYESIRVFCQEDKKFYTPKNYSTTAADANVEWEEVKSNSAWGQISGTLSEQTDLQEALDSKLDKSLEAEKVYGTDNNGNQVVYSAGENIEFYNKSPQVFPGAGDVSYTEVGSLKAEAEQYIDTGLNYHNEVKGPTYDITFRYINLAGDYANGAIFAGRGVEGRWGIGIDSYSRELRIIHLLKILNLLT